MDTTPYLIFLFTIGLILAVRKLLFKLRYKLPPGPLSLPLVGHLPFLDPDRHLYLHNLSVKYGTVFSLYLGTRLTVVVSDFENLKDVANKDEFTGRPPDVFEFNRKSPHFGEMSGSDWKEQRRFMLTSLKELGMGKSSGELLTSTQVTNFLESLKNSIGETVNIRDALMPVTNNIIFAMMMDKEYNFDENIKKAVDNFQSKGIDFFAERSKQFYYPFLRTILNLTSEKIKTGMALVLDLEKNLNKVIKNHEDTFDENSKRDFIDYYLGEIQRKELRTFTKETLLGNAGILIFIGAETFKISLEFSYMNMVSHPEVQEKVYQEIVEVVGTEKLPQWSDRNNMPYTQAVLLEIWRWNNIFGVNDPRWTTEDTKIGKFDVPKGTVVLFLFHSIHHDKEFWGDPENFRPERFLTEDGKKIDSKKAERVLTFSLGKRSCPGETLGKVNIFLYFTAVLQRFKLLPPPEGLDTSIRKSMVNTIENPTVSLELR